MNLPPLILLAAGKSTRMGTPKGLVDFKDEKLLTYNIRHFFSYGGSNIIIVLGHHIEAYFKSFPILERAFNTWGPFEGGQIKTIINPAPDRGQFSSLIEGLKELNEACFILPIDVPTPEENVWHLLAERLSDNISAIKPTFNDEGGHPVLLSSSFINKLKDLSLDHKDARLDTQLNKLSKEQLLRVSCNDSQILQNINTKDDLPQN